MKLTSPISLSPAVRFGLPCLILLAVTIVLAYAHTQADTFDAAFLDGNGGRVLALLKQGAEPGETVCTEIGSSPFWDNFPFSLVPGHMMPRTCMDREPPIVATAAKLDSSVLPIIKELMHKGTIPDRDLDNAFFYSLMNGEEPAAAFLARYQKWEKLSTEEQRELLNTAINGQKPANIRLVIESLAHTGKPLPPILWDIAVDRCSEPAIVLLLDKGMTINQPSTSSGRTAIMTAVMYGSPSFADYLLKRGADIRKTGNCEPAMLDYALMRANGDLVRLLLENGAALR